MLVFNALHSHPPQTAVPAQDEHLPACRREWWYKGRGGPTSCESTPRSLARGVARAGVLTMYCTMGPTTGNSACSMLASTGTSAIRLSSATASTTQCDHLCLLGCEPPSACLNILKKDTAEYQQQKAVRSQWCCQLAWICPMGSVPLQHNFICRQLPRPSDLLGST